MLGEYNYIIALPLASVLFMLGGTGFKWLRRYVMPILLGVLCLFNDISWWRALAYALMLGVGTSLPYGDSLKVVVYEPLVWLLRFLVFSALFLPVLVIGWSPFVVLLPVLTFLLFVLSNTECSERYVPHKLWEGAVGFMVGFNLAFILCQ